MVHTQQTLWAEPDPEIDSFLFEGVVSASESATAAAVLTVDERRHLLEIASETASALPDARLVIVIFENDGPVSQTPTVSEPAFGSWTGSDEQASGSGCGKDYEPY